VLHIETLKTVYFAYFHSIVKYGIIFRDDLVNTKKGILITKECSENNDRSETEMFWYRNVEKTGHTTSTM